MDRLSHPKTHICYLGSWSADQRQEEDTPQQEDDLGAMVNVEVGECQQIFRISGGPSHAQERFRHMNKGLAATPAHVESV